MMTLSSQHFLKATDVRHNRATSSSAPSRVSNASLVHSATRSLNGLMSCLILRSHPPALCFAPGSLLTRTPFISKGRSEQSSRKVSRTVQALHINRRQHLELAWQRQQGEDDLLNQQAAVSSSRVLEVRNLAHLDQLVDRAGSAVVLLYFYSKSCGVCKEVLQYCGQLCQETNQQKAGVLFLKHNIWNEFDDLTDVARMYKAKAVPGFIFLTGGAMVRQLRMPDIRSIYGSSVVLQRMYGYERKRLQATLRELLFRNTPSARR